MNKNQIIDYLKQKKHDLEEQSMIPTIDLVVEMIEAEIDLENQVKNEANRLTSERN